MNYKINRGKIKVQLTRNIFRNKKKKKSNQPNLPFSKIILVAKYYKKVCITRFQN